MASGAALCSDHVNYLIFRYLQEAGHENTAIAFSRDWHRTPEFRDPENYPFAPVVRRNELVSIIQSGLHHDELEARVRKNTRKFQFTYVTARDAGERQHGPVFENGTIGSRPSSSAKRKGRPLSIVRPPDDFPTPAPKRQRRSDGSEGVHLNGDAMEVDATSPDAEADDDGDVVSPALASEPEMTDVPERYDSMDVAVQTDVKTGPKTSTMYWKVDKPGATIYHSVFNPSSDIKNTNTLLAVGESLCRFYQVPEDVNSAKQVQSIDEPSLQPNSVVTASAWHPNGNAAVFAVDGLRELSDGRQISRQAVFSHECNNGISVQYQIPPLLEPQGIVLALRYSPDVSKLLVLQTNIKRGLILVYDNDMPEDGGQARLLAWRIFEHQVLDANWLGSNGFLVCGNNGLSDACFLDANAPVSLEEDINASEMTKQGLGKVLSWIPDKEASRSYDRVRVSTSGAVALVSSSQERKLIVAQYDAGESELHFGAATELRDPVTAIAFQPEPDVDNTQPRFIAMAFEEGGCIIYSYLHQRGEEKASPELKELLAFYLTAGPALALAWSADGSYLALAGTDLVQIWDMRALVRREGQQLEVVDAPHKPLVTWRPDAGALAPRNGEHEEARMLSEPSLSWSADGESLAFAVDKQIAIIRFRPPLGHKDEGGGVNGDASP